jgi:DNA-binding transcriptional LysR family regulator
VSGELIIGASTIPGEYLLPQRAAEFNSRYPELAFEIIIKDSGRIIDDISSHAIHLGVVGTELPSANLEFTPFEGDELVLAAASAMDIPTTIKLGNLLDFDFLTRERGSGTGRTVNHYLSLAGIDRLALRVRATLGSSTAIKEAVKTGLGIAFISKTAIRDERSQGTVKLVEVDGLTMKRSFFVVTPKKRTLPHRYKVFREFLTS